jgi:hypothetical protein
MLFDQPYRSITKFCLTGEPLYPGLRAHRAFGTGVALKRKGGRFRGLFRNRVDVRPPPMASAFAADSITEIVAHDRSARYRADHNVDAQIGVARDECRSDDLSVSQQDGVILSKNNKPDIETKG